MGADGKPATFKPDRVLGVEPLRQFLFASASGRWQVGELGFDPRRSEWFDVYGNEDRRAGEWGHWTGRGMTWNSMCAICHNTRLRKNYRPASDSYATTMAERGVGCEACHGPLARHVAWQRKHGGSATPDATLSRVDRNQMLDTCGSCHARRGDLTGDFVPGQAFSDHFELAVPDESDLFYPDGQVRGEDYEFTAFLGSRMHAAGVRCLDCHQPHTGKNRIPGDPLCLRCHAAASPKIDPRTHSHHEGGTPGSRCVDCHMPQTTYMQRHPRRDHGFRIPDPLLTKQHGIPNACNRCHADRSVDWALAAVEQWYGPRMNRPERTRAQSVAEARAGDASAPAKLIKTLAVERIPLWRSTAARLLRGWNTDPAVSRALRGAAVDPDPMVRASVAHALEGLVQPDDADIQSVLRALLDDSSRSVRVAAAWVSRKQLDTGTVAGRDLLASLDQNLDQPTGLHQMGIWHFDRGENPAGLASFQRAVEWDANSAPLRQALAIALNAQGRNAEAVPQLEAACRLAPHQAEYRYQLGLALEGLGKLPEATAALEHAVQLDAALAPAWYDLGLVYSAGRELERALEALGHAEALQPDNPGPPYARATILARLGRIEAARAAARRTLAIRPSDPEAAELLRSLEAPR